MRRGALFFFAAQVTACSLAFPLDFAGDSGVGGGDPGGGAAGGGSSGGRAGGVAGGASSGGQAGGVAGGLVTSGGAAGGAAGGDAGGGSAGGTAGGVGGGRAGGLAGGIAGGGLAGGRAGGSAGGSVGGGSAGGSVGGGATAGGAAALFDAGCAVIANAPVVYCYDFDSSSPPGSPQRVSASSPSAEMTAEVVFDGGRPGGVLRLTAPGSFSAQNDQQHGIFYRLPVDPRRRLYVAFDVFPVTQENGAQLHYAAFESPGFGQLAFAGDQGGLHLYLSSMSGSVSSTSQGTPLGQWTRLEWFVDLDADVTSVRRANQVVMDAGFMAQVSGGLDLRLGISGLYRFNAPLVVYLDNVVVREVP